MYGLTDREEPAEQDGYRLAIPVACLMAASSSALLLKLQLLGAFDIVLVLGNSDGCEDADDYDCNHNLDEREAANAAALRRGRVEFVHGGFLA